VAPVIKGSHTRLVPFLYCKWGSRRIPSSLQELAVRHKKPLATALTTKVKLLNALKGAGTVISVAQRESHKVITLQAIP